MKTLRGSRRSIDNTRFVQVGQSLLEFVEILAILAARRDHHRSLNFRRKPRKRVLKLVKAKDDVQAR